MSNLNLNLMGLPAANRDLQANLIDNATGRVVATRRPFRDGTVSFGNIDPGLYDVQLVHPNFVLPVTQTGRPIRVLPNDATKASLFIDPKKFSNVAIADTPDVDLGPMITAADNIKDATEDLSKMQGGDTIRAVHWNTLADSVSELAGTVSQLAQAVAPHGHNHSEYEAKFKEITDNFELLLNTLATSMVEIQRRLQLDRLQTRANDLLASVLPQSAAVVTARKEVAKIIDNLYEKATESSTVFSELLVSGTAQIDTLVKNAVGSGGTPRETQKFDEAINTMSQYRAANYTQELQIGNYVNRKLPPARQLVASAEIGIPPSD